MGTAGKRASVGCGAATGGQSVPGGGTTPRCPTPPSSSSPEPAAASAPPPRAGPWSSTTASCWPHAPRTSSTALAEELGGPERALAVRCDVTSWDDQQALVATALERFGRLDVFFANAGFGAKRGFLEESVEHWKAMIDTNVLGRRAVDPRLPPPLPRAELRARAADQLGGRAALGDRLALLVHQARGDGDGRVAAPGGRRDRHQGDADRAGHGRHPVLRRPPERRPGAPTTSPAR